MSQSRIAPTPLRCITASAYAAGVWPRSRACVYQRTAFWNDCCTPLPVRYMDARLNIQQRNLKLASYHFNESAYGGSADGMFNLAVMHLNGVGAMRDCDMAVNLLKRVAERGEWVTDRLQLAYGAEDTPSLQLLPFLELAEAGHEVAQQNLAYLLDELETPLFTELTSRKVGEKTVEFDARSNL